MKLFRFASSAAAAGALLVLLLAAGGTRTPARAAEAAPAAKGQVPIRVRAEGDPGEVGKAVGKALAARIRWLQPLVLGAAVLTTGKSKPQLYGLCAKLAARLAPEDVAEMKGVAEGAGVAYEDILFTSTFYTVVYDGPACRQLAAWGEGTATGELLHARNLDWRDFPGGLLRKNHVIVNVKPDKGVEYAFLTWPGLQAVLTGTNRKGLTVGFNRMHCREWREAEPVIFTLKRVLRGCGTVEEAVALISKARPMGNGSVLVSDAKRKTAVVVELYEGEVGVRKAAGSMIGNANHYTAESWGKDFRGQPRGDASWPTCDAAGKLKGKLTPESLQKVMASPDVIQEMNILGVIFRPAANRMLLACGKEPAAAGIFTEHVIFPDDEENGGKDAAAGSKAGGGR